MDEERTIEGAVDVYLERLDGLTKDGFDLRSAKAAAMVVALVWLGVDDEREEYQPEILDALAQRRGAHLVGVTNGKPKP